MKILKVTLLSILSISVIIYLAFLFALPNLVDLNKYAPQIADAIQKNTGLQVEIKGLKVTTAWNLSAGAQIDKTDLMYSNGEKFSQINGLKIRLSLIPMLFHRIIIDKIDAEKVLANIDLNNKELLNLVQGKEEKKKVVWFNHQLVYSADMPDISAKKYRISFLDGQNNYTVKGLDFKVTDFILNKKVKVQAAGNLILNGRKQISYDAEIHSKVFPTEQIQNFDGVKKFFADLYNYNLKSDIKAKLKINPDSDIDGEISFSKLCFTFAGNVLPQGSLALVFDGNEIKINSILYTDLKSKIFVTGLVKNGRHKAVDLKVSSDKINLSNAVLIAKAILKSIGKNDLDAVSASGFAKAQFNIKSDFKKVDSSGYLRIKDASIVNKLYNVSLNSVNADVDFSQDSVNIRQAAANLNSQPITISGKVDKNANANILVLAKNLQLKGVLLATGNPKILEENDILSGRVNLKALLKGRLDKVKPKVEIVASDINLKNKKSKTQVKVSKAEISSTSTKGEGQAKLTQIQVIPQVPSKISLPMVVFGFDKNNIDMKKTFLYINNIKTNFSGKISHINSTPQLKDVVIEVPNQITVPIQGYHGSKMTVKGRINVKGNLYKPEIDGNFVIPSIRIPSAQTVVKNATVEISKDIIISAPSVQIADSLVSLSAIADKDFSKGVTVKNLNFNSSNLDLNTILPFYRSLPQNSSTAMVILHGKSSIQKFVVGDITSSSITSNLSMHNDILHMANVRANAYLGKIGGDISYDLKHRKTTLNLQGRGLSANPTFVSLTGRDDDIHGILDFDSNISLIGFTPSEAMHSLKGDTNFIISNGKMGVLGMFEHLIYAQNVVSNNVFRMTLNGIAKAVSLKNTGVYRYMKGKVHFSNGWANIAWIKTSGPTMSLYMTGRYYFSEDYVNLTILGRISNDVVRILGPIGEFSMDKVISYVPKIGEITAFFANQFTTNPVYENTSMIPYLTPRTEFPTKEFKVIIDGEAHKQSSVKSFKWLARPRIGQVQPAYVPPVATKKQVNTVPDFVNKLPDYRR